MSKRLQVYTAFMEQFKKDLIVNYDRLGLRASGKYAEALEYVVKDDRLIMYGAKHSKYMNDGRGPGPADYKKIAPFIYNWIENKKGLPPEFYEKKKQFSFMIAHKIAKEGIKVPNQHNAGEVITEVVTRYLGELLFRMLESLGESYIKESDIVSDFKKLVIA